MALLYENSPPKEEQSDATTPSVTPRRRSTRVQRSVEDEGLKPNGNPQKPSQGLQSNGRSEGGGKVDTRSLVAKMKPSKLERARVDKAMERLREMEGDFYDTTKRQKRMVDESLVNAPKREEEGAFFPTPREANPPSISPTTEKKGLDQMDPILGKEQGGNPLPAPLAGGDPEDRDLFSVPEETDINLFKQEGARAPPVNSDYLPLPWKGRLGYVNRPADRA